MWGLMYKDLLVFRKKGRIMLLLLAFYVVLAALGMFDTGVIITILAVLPMMLPTGAFSYDEAARWNRYAMALPLSRRQVVGARYLFTLLMLLLSLACGLLCCLWGRLRDGWAWGESLPYLLGVLLAVLGMQEVMLPLNYLLGPERARPLMFPIVLLPMLLLIFLSRWEGRELFTPLLSYALPLLFLLSAAGLAVSFHVSCRIVRAKEY